MYRNILVAIDDAESSKHAITNASGLAKATGAKVILFHVVTPINPLVSHDEHVAGVHAAQEVVEQAQQDAAAGMTEQSDDLQKLADVLIADGITAVAEVVEGDAEAELVRVIEQQDIDLVVISTHARRGISRAFLGSIADEIIHDVKVPVLIVKRS